MSENQLANSTGAAPATQSAKRTFQQLVESELFKSQIMAALPRHLTADRFIRVLMTATIKNPQLLECTQESMFRGIFDCAAIGLEIDGRRAHLIPLRNRKKPGQPLEANLWLDYKGIAELVMRSGLVSNIHADVVCENDEFEYDRGELKKHKIDFKKDRGVPYAAYCLIRMKDGSEKVEVMDRESIERIRRSSPGADADPWRNHWGEMAKKTVFKRVSKWVPLSPEIKNAMDADNEDEPLNVTNSTHSDAPQIEGGSAPEPEIKRAAPPPRAKKGAAAVQENKPAELPIDVEASAPTLTTQADIVKEHVADVKQAVADALARERQEAADKRDALSAKLAKEAKANLEAERAEAESTADPPKQKAFLQDGERFSGVCKVAAVTGFMATLGGVPHPSCQGKLTGDFWGEFMHIDGGVQDGADVKPLPVWAVGNAVRVTMLGKKSEKLKKVVARVEKVEAVAEDVE